MNELRKSQCAVRSARSLVTAMALAMVLIGTALDATKAAALPGAYAAGTETDDVTPPPIATSPTFEELLVTTAPGAPSPTFEDQVLEIVNQERWTNGMLAPLKGNHELAAAAEGHSQAMAERNFFSHCDLDTGSMPSQRTAAAGYVGNGSAENALAGARHRLW